MTDIARKTVSVKLDNLMHDRIRHLAEAQQRKPHWVMRQAIEQYVDRAEKQEAFRQAALQAWEEYQETGLYVTGDEVIAWLETWGEENESAAPMPVPAPNGGGVASGKFVARVPKSIDAQLAARARMEGISFNAMVLTLLANGLGQETRFE